MMEKARLRAREEGLFILAQCGEATLGGIGARQTGKGSAPERF
jgi:hypothetical protein